MWLEVRLPHTDYYVTWCSAVPLPHMEYSLAWSSAFAQGIYWDFKFRSSASAYRIVCDLGALKLRNSASAQGKYCGLEVRQFHFHTINLVWLEVSQFRFHTRALTFKSRNSASAQRIFCDSKFSSSAFAHKTVCHLMFRIFAKYTVTWISTVPLPQEKTSFEIPHFCFCTRILLFFGKSTLIQQPTHPRTHPFLNFRAVLHEW